MRIAIASDHAAVDLKTELRDYLIGLGHEVADLGAVTADRVDYPDYGYKLAAVISDGTEMARRNAGWRCADRASAFRSRSIAIPPAAVRGWTTPMRRRFRASITMPMLSPWARG